LFIGVGVAVVIALVAAFLLTRGDDKKKVSATSSSSSSSARRSSSSSSSSSSSETTDSSGDAAPPGFHTVTQSFERGTVEVFVPDDWTDVQPVKLDNGEPRLRVAPNVAAFIDGSFTTPGVQIDAFSVDQNNVADPSNMDALLDNFLQQPPESDGVPGGPASTSCTSGSRDDYPQGLSGTSDGGFVGRFEALTACKGAGGIVVIFAVPSDQSFILQVVIQTVSTADLDAVPTIAGSILVADFP